MYRQLTNFFPMTLLLLITMACAPLAPVGTAGTIPAGTVPAPTATAADEATVTTLTLYIAPTRVDCMGVAPMQCMQVKFDEDSTYELFYDGIDGFVYVPGYAYTLRVQRMTQVNPPADGSAYVYSLIEVMSKTPADTGDTLPLEGVEWQLVAFGDEAMVTYQPDAATISATFSEGRLTGNAGCNNYSAEYTMAGTTLALSPVIATRMACADESVMAAETAYLNALAAVGDYAIAGNMLTITYAAGQLTFMAVEPVNTGATSATAETLCNFAGTGATIAVAGQRANFTCGAPDVVLLGEVVPGANGWLISQATLTRQNDAFVAEEPHQVTVRAIALADGQRCAWAGSGATLAVAGQRVNFTCGGPNAVLIGAIQLGDDGWLIQQATVRQGDAGLVVTPGALAPISGLVVTQAEN